MGSEEKEKKDKAKQRCKSMEFSKNSIISSPLAEPEKKNSTNTLISKRMSIRLDHFSLGEEMEKERKFRDEMKEKLRPRALSSAESFKSTIGHLVGKEKRKSRTLILADDKEEAWMYRSTWPSKWPSRTNDPQHPPLIIEESGFNSEFGSDEKEDRRASSVLAMHLSPSLSLSSLPSIGSLSASSSSLDDWFFIEDSELDVPFYQEQIAETAHVNFYADDEENGPVVISLECAEKKDTFRAIIRSKKGDDRVIALGTNEKERLKFLQSIVPELINAKITKPTIDHQLQVAALVNYEKKFLTRTYKFGVLYLREGQTKENEWYSNVEVSPEYEEFLEILGQKIELKGWKGFRGGLDVTNNTTGTHSIYSTFRQFEIMFHVATMLPSDETDLQRLERKRHIGNDIVVIVYKENKEPFSPLSINSQFNHTFIVVERIKGDGRPQYRVNITNKFGVKPNRPILPHPPVFDGDEFFQKWLLAKMINSERAAMYAPDFRGKKTSVRKQVLLSVVQEFSPDKNQKKIFGISI